MSDETTPGPSGLGTSPPDVPPDVNESERRVIAAFRRRLGMPKTGTASWDVETRYAELATRLGIAEPDGTSAPDVIARAARPVPSTTAGRMRPGPSLRTFEPRAWQATAWGVGRVVAGVLAVCFAFGIVWQGRTVSSRHRTPPAPTTYVTQNGQRANVVLPDGSIVRLNVASRLEVPADFTTGRRAVRLSGEAIFSVAHRGGSPFTVTTHGVTTTVLGTTFLVRHYAADTGTTVSVRDGKVSVGPIALTAGRAVRAERDGRLRLLAADPAQFTFADGVLTLDGVPLRDAVVELNRWYDADIRLADPALGQSLVQGAFTAGSRTDLSTILAFTFHVRVVRDGRVLTLYPR